MRMNVFPVRHRIFLFMATLWAMGASGCAVLTPSQVQEVERFAQATKSYDVLPGAVIEAQAELRKREKIYAAAGFIPGDTSLAQIEDASAARQEYQKRADQAERLLSVLDEYARLLVALTADNFTSDLQDEAQKLGERIDRGIGEYNAAYQKEFKDFGGIIAAGVRGAGGLYIKRRQTLALREAVTRADPLMEEMTVAVNGLLDLYLTTSDGEGFIRQTEQDIKELFLANVQGSMAKQPLYVAIHTAETLELAENAYRLAEKARAAIGNLRQSHRALKENLQRKQTLTSAIETVKVFADEVGDATVLKKKLSR